MLGPTVPMVSSLYIMRKDLEHGNLGALKLFPLVIVIEAFYLAAIYFPDVFNSACFLVACNHNLMHKLI